MDTTTPWGAVIISFFFYLNLVAAHLFYLGFILVWLYRFVLVADGIACGLLLWTILSFTIVYKYTYLDYLDKKENEKETRESTGGRKSHILSLFVVSACFTTGYFCSSPVRIGLQKVYFDRDSNFYQSLFGGKPVGEK